MTVLHASRDANEALSRFGHHRDSVATLVDRKMSFERSAQITALRNAGGAASTLAVLNAQADQIPQDDLLHGQAQLTSDWIRRRSALGSRWQPGKRPV